MFTEFFEFFTHPLGLLVLAFFAVGCVFTRGRGGAVVANGEPHTEDKPAEYRPLDIRDWAYGYDRINHDD